MSAANVLPLLEAATALPRKTFNHPAKEMLGGTAFYRRTTEAMLRRYMRASMEMGRTPSLLGTNIFRGRVSSYRLRTFEDCIIFLFDMEKCLQRLDPEAKMLIARITLQEYTYEETAKLTEQSERSVGRKYSKALDQLTDVLLELGLLEQHPF